MRKGVFVALAGPALGHLTAPAQAAQELPEVCGMIAPPHVDLHHGREAGPRPPLVGKAAGPGARQQQLHHVLALRSGQWARSPRHRLGRQGPGAPCPPGRAPLVHRAHRCLHPTRHLAQAQPVCQERHGAASPSFPCLG